MTYVSQVIADGAVGLWEFAEPSGTTATDQTANSNGTYSGATVTLGQTGIPGGGGATAASQSGTTGVCTVPVVAANTTTDTFSVEWWMVLPANPAATRGVMGVNTTAVPMIRITTAGKFGLTKQAVADVCYSTSAVPLDGNFHHCVITKNAATATHVYLDGVDVSGAVSNQTFSSSSGHSWLLMKNNVDSSLVATFAMFAVYTTAISPTVVSNHFTLGSSSGVTSIPQPGFRFGFN